MDKDADVETGGEQVSLETSHQTAVTDAALSITVKHKGPAFGNKNANEPLSSEWVLIYALPAAAPEFNESQETAAKAAEALIATGPPINEEFPWITAS